MPLDPDVVKSYSTAKAAYDEACNGGAAAEVLEAGEVLREVLATYILDLEVNGFSVSNELTEQMDELSQDPPI